MQKITAFCRRIEREAAKAAPLGSGEEPWARAPPPLFLEGAPRLAPALQERPTSGASSSNGTRSLEDSAPPDEVSTSEEVEEEDPSSGEEFNPSDSSDAEAPQAQARKRPKEPSRPAAAPRAATGRGCGSGAARAPLPLLPSRGTELSWTGDSGDEGSSDSEAPPPKRMVRQAPPPRPSPRGAAPPAGKPPVAPPAAATAPAAAAKQRRGASAPSDALSVRIPAAAVGGCGHCRLLVELPPELDLHGDAGVVGRVAVPQGSEAVQLDLKGVVYDAEVVRLQGTAAIAQLARAPAGGGGQELVLGGIFGTLVRTAVSRDFLAENWGGGCAAGGLLLGRGSDGELDGQGAGTGAPRKRQRGGDSRKAGGTAAKAKPKAKGRGQAGKPKAGRARQPRKEAAAGQDFTKAAVKKKA